MTERWQTIVRFPRYEASNLGCIRIIASGRLVAPQSCGTGRYKKVALFYEGGRRDETVHQLVAETFHGPRPTGRVCAHLNSIGTDNRAANLAWVTRQENEAHKPTATPPVTRREIALAAGMIPQSELSRRHGVSVATVQRIQRAARAETPNLPLRNPPGSDGEIG